MPPENAVYCTLLLSDDYLPGAMVLAHSLRDAGTAARLAVLYTPDTLQSQTIAELESIYDDLIPVHPIPNTTTPASLFLMNRPDLIATFTKVELWRQTQFQRIVYLDADVLAIRAPDELLSLSLPTSMGEKGERIAAAPDTGWPDCFNSGVMVLSPSMADYRALRALAEQGITFDGADQGLLNMYFGEDGWKRLRFGYNCTATRIPDTRAGVSAGYQYQYLPAYRHFAGGVSLAHFVGAVKPWSAQQQEQQGEVYNELVGRWWEIYRRCYRPSKESVSGLKDHGRAQERVLGTSETPEKPYASHTGGSDDPGLHFHDPQSTGTTSSNVAHEHLETTNNHTSTFVPPMAEWDASREPPPPNTKPEGIALQQQTYRMSTDTRLFQPEPYSAIPQTVITDMSVLAKPEPEKIAQIFPWEGRAPRPTRVFADGDSSVSTAPTTSTMSSEEEEGQSTGEETPPVSDTETKIEQQQQQTPSWQTYTRSNAWDKVPEIQQFVQSIEDARARAREAERRTDEKEAKSNNHEDAWSGSSSTQKQPSSDGIEGTSDTSLSSSPGHGQKEMDGINDEWVSVTAGGFLDLVQMVYLYWAFTNVTRRQPT